MISKVSLSVRLVPSVDNIVTVSLVVPLSLVYVRLVKVALISVSLPLIVTLDVPLPLKVAVPLAVTFSTPPVTVSFVLVKLPFVSVTLTPLIAVCVCSVTVCVPGTVFTGGS